MFIFSEKTRRGIQEQQQGKGEEVNRSCRQLFLPGGWRGGGKQKKSFIYSFFPVAHPVESFCGTSSNLSPPPPMMDGVAIPGYFFQPPPLCRGFFFCMYACVCVRPSHPLLSESRKVLSRIRRGIVVADAPVCASREG